MVLLSQFNMQVSLSVLLPQPYIGTQSDKNSWKGLQQFPHSEACSLDVLQGGFVMVACVILVSDLEIGRKWQPGASIWQRMTVLPKDSAVRTVSD